ncbi:MAG: DUF4038 domain-containing protein [Clostridiales bacterium]|nr:DUF4038 domain-containing protein [Clostridiales bacterium]
MTELIQNGTGRHLASINGSTSYLIGDTAWELFSALDRDEAEHYLRTRSAQGFNMIQAVILAELDGLKAPNAYGRLPLKVGENGLPDPLQPDIDGEYSYFDHVEFIIDYADKLGLIMGILPTWGDKWNKASWGKGPEIFTPENARGYGQWLAERLAPYSNIFWILGGDRSPEKPEHYAITDAMAEGIRKGDAAAGRRRLMTFHPSGVRSSSEFFHDREWLDFNMLQSGHGRPAPAAYELLSRDYNRTPVKPTMDGEQVYEDHPINFDAGNGYYDAADVRVTMWRNLFSGSCGNTYGHHSVWCMNREPGGYFTMKWDEALHRPAAQQIIHLRNFVDAHNPADMVPDEKLVTDNRHNANYIAAAVDAGNRRLYFAVPNGCPFRIDFSALPFAVDGSNLSAKLYEPKTGETNNLVAISPGGHVTFPGRAAGRGEDAVVIVSC